MLYDINIFSYILQSLRVCFNFELSIYQIFFLRGLKSTLFLPRRNKSFFFRRGENPCLAGVNKILSPNYEIYFRTRSQHSMKPCKKYILLITLQYGYYIVIIQVRELKIK